MASLRRTSRYVVGLIRVNDHCLFTWRGPAPEAFEGTGNAPRFVEVTGQHCQACVDEVQGLLGFGVIDLRRADAPRATITPSGRFAVISPPGRPSPR